MCKQTNNWRMTIIYYICKRSFFPKVSYVILWLLWEKFSLSLYRFLSFSFFSPSQTTDLLGYFWWGNADCLLLISVRCRHFNSARARAREREIDLRSAIREREKKKKYYRNGQSHHLSHVCMCRLTCESILSANVHTHKQNQSTAEENVIASERECAIKKRPIETVILAFFFFLSFFLLFETNKR